MNLQQASYKQRLAAAWPDPLPYGTPAARKPAAAAPAPAPAAPAPEAPPFRELAQARSAAQHAKQLLEAAWPDDQPASSMAQDDVDPDEARQRELKEIDEDIALLNRRRARLTGEGKG